MNTRLFTAWSLILAPLMLMIGFTSLTFTFDYPDILRQPTGEVLTRFHEGGVPLVAQWYSMVLASILFVPAAVFLHTLIAHRPLAPLVTCFGVIAAVMNVLGFIRWPFLVPVLAERYTAPGLGEAARESIETVFAAFHTYGGLAVGEHLGFTFLALWLVGAGFLMRGVLPGWLSWLWIVTGVGTFLGVFEPVGWGLAADINAVASSAAMVAVMLAGILVLSRPKTYSPRFKIDALAGTVKS